MSIVKQNEPTVPSVSRFWVGTWHLPDGVKPMCQHGAGHTGDDDEPIRIEKYSVAELPHGCNWPTFAVGEDQEVKTLVYQMEICPTTSKPHLQVYAEISKTGKNGQQQGVRLSYAKTVLGMAGGHFEARAGTRDQCIAYCSKTDTRKPGCCPIFLGAAYDWRPAPEGKPEYKGRQGQRTDITGMVDMIKSGKRLFDQLEADPVTFVKFARGMQEVRRVVHMSKAKTIRDVHVEIHWGVPGSGKTRHVYDKHGIENVFTLIADNNACWFDGYEGEDVLLIDDFKGWITYTLLLKILDIYPVRLPLKGSFTNAAWTKVYITSNYEPSSWYRDVDFAALKRRVHKVYHYGKLHRMTVNLTEDSSDEVGETPERAGAGAGAGEPTAHAPGFYSPLTRSLTSLCKQDFYDDASDSDDDDDDGSD